MQPEYDSKLKEMFITMSTNKDLRKVLKYYDEQNYDKQNIVGDFATVMENLTTEEIADRLSYDLFIKFEGIEINNNHMYDSIICSKWCNKVQTDIISEKADLSMISIQLILDNDTATPETLDRLIKNSTDPTLGDLESEKLCLLNKESIAKLVKVSNNNPEFIYLLSLKKGLEVDEIDNILSVMKEKEIEMDNLYAENLLEQENLTKEQLKKIAFFEKIPCGVTFSTCVNKNVYTNDDIVDIYKDSKNDEQIVNIILNLENIPNAIVNDLWLSNNEYAKATLLHKLEWNASIKQQIEDMQNENLSPIRTNQIINTINQDIRILDYAVNSNNPDILDACLPAIENFYNLTGIEKIYNKRCELLNKLTTNENIDNLTLDKILSENSDAFSAEQIRCLNAKIEDTLTEEEADIIQGRRANDIEEFEDEMLDRKISSHRYYSGDYDIDENR